MEHVSECPNLEGASALLLNAGVACACKGCTFMAIGNNRARYCGAQGCVAMCGICPAQARLARLKELLEEGQTKLVRAWWGLRPLADAKGAVCL